MVSSKNILIEPALLANHLFIEFNKSPIITTTKHISIISYAYSSLPARAKGYIKNPYLRLKLS